MIRKPKIYKRIDSSVKKVRFSKRIIIVMFVSMGLFTVTMTVIYILTGGVPDTLITEFFGFFGFEGSALGIIKVAETISKNITKGKDKNKNESETKTDIP